MTAPSFPIAGEARDRVMQIGDEHGRGIIRSLPIADQIAIAERIAKFPPDRATQLWARRLFLDLTKPEGMPA